jgi:hypothetical protein
MAWITTLLSDCAIDGTLADRSSAIWVGPGQTRKCCQRYPKMATPHTASRLLWGDAKNDYEQQSSEQESRHPGHGWI